MITPLLDGDPTRMGPYRLRARLGGGGMGQVYLGRSLGGHTVAVKVVRPELAQDPDFLRRFATEVAAARRVGGFYTAQVVSADTDGTPPWLATAYIPGPTLHRAVADHGPLPSRSVAVLGAGLAEGLAAVHAVGLVHRDLKPANVLLTQDGPRVIDFGIARALDSTSHTHSSTVLGTAAFMSPEQARAQPVGPPSDVFSLGCVLAFAATGRSPFGEGPIHAVVFRVVHEEPDLTGMPASLVDPVKACLAREPADRPDLEHLVARLGALTSGDTDTAGGTGGWLPEDLTEVVGQHRTLALTTVDPPPATGPERSRTPARPTPVPTGRPLPTREAPSARARTRTHGTKRPHPARGYRNAVYVLLGLLSLLSLITVVHQSAFIAGLDQLHLRGSFLDEGPTADYSMGPVWVAQVFTGIALIVAWVNWFVRVRGVAERFGRVRFNPDMTWFGWFVPLVNLVVPKRIADDVWHVSSPHGTGGRSAPAGLLNTWWVMWLATFVTWPVFWFPWGADLYLLPSWMQFIDRDIVNRGSGWGNWDFDFELQPLFWISLATHLLVVPAAIVTALYVRRLTDMQVSRLNE